MPRYLYWVSAASVTVFFGLFVGNAMGALPGLLTAALLFLSAAALYRHGQKHRARLMNMPPRNAPERYRR